MARRRVGVGAAKRVRDEAEQLSVPQVAGDYYSIRDDSRWKCNHRVDTHESPRLSFTFRLKFYS